MMNKKKKQKKKNNNNNNNNDTDNNKKKRSAEKSTSGLPDTQLNESPHIWMKHVCFHWNIALQQSSQTESRRLMAMLQYVFEHTY